MTVTIKLQLQMRVQWPLENVTFGILQMKNEAIHSERQLAHKSSNFEINENGKHGI